MPWSRSLVAVGNGALCCEIREIAVLTVIQDRTQVELLRRHAHSDYSEQLVRLLRRHGRRRERPATLMAARVHDGDVTVLVGYAGRRPQRPVAPATGAGSGALDGHPARALGARRPRRHVAEVRHRVGRVAPGAERPGRCLAHRCVHATVCACGGYGCFQWCDQRNGGMWLSSCERGAVRWCCGLRASATPRPRRPLPAPHAPAGS